MGGRGAAKNPNARAIKTQKERKRRESKRVLKQLLKISGSNTTEKLQKVAKPVLKVQIEDKSSPSVVKEFFADELPIVFQELDEESILAEISATEKSKFKGNKRPQEKKKSVQKTQKRNREEVSDHTGTGENSETLKRQPKPRFIMQLHPDLADKYENFNEMRRLSRESLVNRFMANSFGGLICYGIVVEYDRDGDRYLVAYHDGDWNYVPWTSLSWLILSEKHVEESKIIQLRDCVESREYIHYNKIKNTMGSL